MAKDPDCQLSVSDLSEWIQRSETLLLKKLSRNDCSWADGLSNQDGFYVPAEIRKASFFPDLKNVNQSKPHILEVPHLKVIWPATNEEPWDLRVVHYSNKGSEMQVTRPPKVEFAGLTPASLLLGGRLVRPLGEARYWFTTIDSSSDSAEALESDLDLAADFHFGLFAPDHFKRSDPSEELVVQLERALASGRLNEFIASSCGMPLPDVLAVEARRHFMKEQRLEQMDPFELDSPGDALMSISRDIEFRLYKAAERRRRAAEMLRVIVDGGGLAGGTPLVRALVQSYARLDAMFLSAGQQRKSRAGLSFELHIAELLKNGRIPFQEQMLTGSRRPDFVMPNVQTLRREGRPFDEAVVLAAKTTLRERWKQISSERLNCALFLATVDDRISSAAIEDMGQQDIILVVPESLKQSNETVYRHMENVITFKVFFREEIRRKRLAIWALH